jgi:hypothetical protein
MVSTSRNLPKYVEVTSFSAWRQLLTPVSRKILNLSLQNERFEQIACVLAWDFKNYSSFLK